LIKLQDPERQIKLVEEIIEQQLNVKQTEERIANLNKPKKKKKQPRLKGVNKDIRIAMNTIRQSLNMVSDTGIKVETDEEDHEDYYQITIKLRSEERRVGKECRSQWERSQ